MQRATSTHPQEHLLIELYIYATETKVIYSQNTTEYKRLRINAPFTHTRNVFHNHSRYQMKLQSIKTL